MPPAEITICVLLHEFQKRLWWMLSSLVQQVAWQGQPVPKLTIRLSISRDDARPDLTGRLLKVFGALLELDVCEREGNGPIDRGKVRDRDAREARSEWLLFSDADTLYHPEFWARVAVGPMAELPADRSILTCSRESLQCEDGYRLADSAEYRDQPIPTAYATAEAVWRPNPGRASPAIGIGYFQLARRQAVLDRGGYILASAPAENCLADTFNRTPSDYKFRKGWRIVPVEGLPALLHLQHRRRHEPGWYEHCR